MGALDVTLLSSEQKQANIQDAKLDYQNMQLCKAISKGANNDTNFTRQEELLGWNGSIYVPKAMRSKVLKSEHDSKVAGHFGRDRTLELINRNFFWPKIEDNV